jgi:hypothetical protein
VVHARVEEFHDQSDTAFLGLRQDFLQAFRAVFHAGLVVQPVTIAGETDEMLETRVGHGVDGGSVGFGEEFMVLLAIKCAFDGAEFFALRSVDGRERRHRAAQPVLFQRGEIGRGDQLDGLQPMSFPATQRSSSETFG